MIKNIENLSPELRTEFKKKTINFSGVTPEVWARTVILFLALVNQILAILGKEQIPFAENDIYQICSLIATFVSAIWAWWKNNSFSESAQAGDTTMKSMEGIELEYTKKANQPDTDHYVGRG